MYNKRESCCTSSQKHPIWPSMVKHHHHYPPLVIYMSDYQMTHHEPFNSLTWRMKESFILLDLDTQNLHPEESSSNSTQRGHYWKVFESLNCCDAACSCQEIATCPLASEKKTRWCLAACIIRSKHDCDLSRLQGVCGCVLQTITKKTLLRLWRETIISSRLVCREYWWVATGLRLHSDQIQV